MPTGGDTHHGVGEMRDYPLWQMKGSAPVTRGGGLSRYPSGTDMGSPAASVLGPVTPSHLLGSVYTSNVYLNGPLENFPKDEVLVPWTWILRAALGARSR